MRFGLSLGQMQRLQGLQECAGLHVVHGPARRQKPAGGKSIASQRFCSRNQR